ncbi:hypothetical protein A3C09_01695 [Candidatus Uhrbacteria bacterium RIFCSPHIGHO2_02_FULL_47_44]|nr:MAG: hypothetical protein A2839_04350 [Candidatus Uhrbacteria bacterium RIFCSPHIGHO2_01_FULL_47_10]OGL70985.1 MAG: hypothetical protein A3C09_01695 [Candidatus Uhrbacteria bacterium RIFCSPHIGHO2_02_FULL_47_44]OGL77749.1 MAG: hypothetical protein A3E97_00150 [Candidatus Uhrbacteria bacterium RIFCSPHIGHO2_12_FULL_47_12]OGL80519.1 MAG: hypothetical protein A3B20_03895 [Candidatus Uhrbacteria bacterium RIFCSPLOWO2_01_FULL_47_17]OGL93158.1 MAG: hypothetical protein A3H12_02995 [Candidatus Uhrbact
MKNLQKHLYWFLLPAVLLVLLDEWIKAFALTHFPDESTLVDPGFLNLAIHKNWGLAFDIPFRREFILLISIVIGYFLVEMIVKNFKSHPKIAFSSLMILIGAIGNVFDRVYYGFTVDYLIFFGRSALNLSDLLIILGVIFLLISSRQSTTTHKTEKDV